MHRRFASALSSLGLLAVLATSLQAPSARAQLADYAAQAEMSAAVLAMDGALGGRVRVHQIGRGPDALTPIYAVQIGQLDANGVLVEDDPTKPGLLIECGPHAREWAAAEACYRFLNSGTFGTVFDGTAALGDMGVRPPFAPSPTARGGSREGVGLRPNGTRCLPGGGRVATEQHRVPSGRGSSCAIAAPWAVRPGLGLLAGGTRCRRRGARAGETPRIRAARRCNVRRGESTW